MRGGLARAGVLLIGSTLLACISPMDPLDRHGALVEIQKQYTDLVRWGEIERASSYVVPEQREQFLGLAEPFSTLRVTDVEIGDTEYEGGSAFVTVTYRGYSMSHMVEHTSRVRQEWVPVGGLSNAWQVRSELEIVLADLSGLPRPTGGGDEQ